MKRISTFLLALSLVLAMTACGSKPAPAEPAAQPIELTVFAAASLTDTMDAIIQQYKTVAPHVTIVPTYDSSGTLLTQIKEGAPCDLFFSAAQKQMNALDGALKDNAEKNPDGLDMIDTDSRVNLLENKVVLAVPEGNPKSVETFDELSTRLQAGDILLAMGNSDVPVGQYTQKIFTYYGLDEAAMASAGALTYGSNVKEVTTQISEGTVDCGIIYATDAASAGLTVADSATAEMCGQVIYPAAVLSASEHPDEAKAFLDYLKTDAAMEIFQGVGFSPAV